jgi:hypothetical protein
VAREWNCRAFWKAIGVVACGLVFLRPGRPAVRQAIGLNSQRAGSPAVWYICGLAFQQAIKTAGWKASGLAFRRLPGHRLADQMAGRSADRQDSRMAG